METLRPAPYGAACAAAALLLCGLGALLPEFAVLQATQWAVYGLLALSLVLVWGHAGIFSFGQGAFFGIGAYVYAIAALHAVECTHETFSALLLAAAAGALLAALLGWVMFYGKVGDVYVGVMTLALTLVLFTALSSTADPKYRIGQALLGGYNGMTGVPPLTWPGADGGTELGTRALFYTVVWLCALWLALLRWLLARPFGRVLAALRENAWRAQLLGFDVRLRKLLAFALGAALAALAGGLHAAWALFVSPGVFGLPFAALVVIWTLVGGRQSLAGAFVGVLLVEALTFTLGSGAGEATPIVLGAVLIAVVLFLPGGLVPALQGALRRRVPPAPLAEPAAMPDEADAADTAGDVPLPYLPAQAAQAGAAAPLPALQTQQVSLHFGGVQAVRDASIAFAARGVHCLIGPNGAGKSSFFNLLLGRFAPSSGRVLLRGRNIARLPPHARVRLGLGAKLQVASIFAALSVQENLWLAAWAHTRDAAAAQRSAAQWLAWLGKSGFAARAARAPASDLAHGQKQWLEIAMLLAGAPHVILLDEPAAGMSQGERARLAQLVRTLGEHAAVILVEHDMAFVAALQAPVTVLHQGGVFATGTMHALRRNPQVLDIYLGRA